jgi:hypothetical protein
VPGEVSPWIGMDYRIKNLLDDELFRNINTAAEPSRKGSCKEDSAVKAAAKESILNGIRIMKFFHEYLFWSNWD